jgi:RNA polymerase sigma-70 factor, ECF subfamily
MGAIGNHDAGTDAAIYPYAMTPGLSDDQIDMARLVAGHDAALNDLMSRHGDKLFHYLIRSLQNEDEAADLAQETFVRVYQHRAKFNPAQKFSTWLYAIASNLVRDCYRSRVRHPQVSLNTKNETSEVELGEQLPDEKLIPSESMQMAERTEAIRKAVAALPEELSTPLILAEYEEMSQAEIGEILECSVKAVETRIYRARKQLRETLKTYFQSI